MLDETEINPINLLQMNPDSRVYLGWNILEICVFVQSPDLPWDKISTTDTQKYSGSIHKP